MEFWEGFAKSIAVIAVLTFFHMNLWAFARGLDEHLLPRLDRIIEELERINGGGEL